MRCLLPRHAMGACVLFVASLPLLPVPARSSGEVWQLEASAATRRENATGGWIDAISVAYAPDILDAALHSAPRAGARQGRAIRIPGPTGELVGFELFSTPTLSPGLQQTRPDLRTFAGRTTDGSGLEIRLTISSRSLTARVEGPRGWSIETAAPGIPVVTVWANADDPRIGEFRCGVDASLDDESARTGAARALPTGDELRTYRIAISGPGEFAVYHGSVADAEDEIAALVNLANAVFERDLAVQMQLVDINVYPDPATDPFTNGTSMTDLALAENHSALVSKLGNNGFDIGHVVSQLNEPGWSGLGALGVLCDRNNKGRGGTFARIPTAFQLQEGILHEVGHQLGARHSFNGSTGACGPNRSAGWAYEIASGVTIMSYAGICGTENVVVPRLLHYDAGALEAIEAEIASVGSCGDSFASGNTPPVADAGPDLTIPRGTAFILDGSSSSDADGDALTFSWEQHDLGPASPPYGPEFGPLFRNFAPGANPLRVVPSYGNYRIGNPTPWEFLPTTDRVLTFRLVVRDNAPGSGGTDWDDRVLTVAGEPFRVASPDGGESFPAGAPTPVSWQVGGGAVAPEVRVLFSTDGGLEWTEIEALTPNDGSHTPVIPCETTSQARVRLEGAGNIFYDISDADFTVTADATPPVVGCPAPIEVVATSAEGIAADDPALASWIASATVTDNCDPDPPITFASPPTLPIGTNDVSFFSVDASNNFGLCPTQVTVSQPTASPPTAGRTALVGIHPNPFNPRTSIHFRLARGQDVTLEVLDLRGRRVAVLHQGPLGPGPHAVPWDGGGAGSGVYFARLQTADGVFHQRMALLK